MSLTVLETYSLQMVAKLFSQQALEITVMIGVNVPTPSPPRPCCCPPPQGGKHLPSPHCGKNRHILSLTVVRLGRAKVAWEDESLISQASD